MKTKKLVISHATEWKKMREEGELVQLPSGFVVKLHPVSLEKLYTTGSVPDALTSIVANIVSSGQIDVTDLMSTATKMVELKRIVCEAAVLSPRIVEEPDYENDEISYFDLSSEDSEFIMSWAQRPQKDLERFRTGYDAALELARNSQDILDTSKSASGSEG